MSNVPSDLRYLKSHEWARLEADGTITISISDHAQQALGDEIVEARYDDGDFQRAAVQGTGIDHDMLSMGGGKSMVWPNLRFLVIR